jgi:uncharacterized protein (TIGR02996 family)
MTITASETEMDFIRAIIENPDDDAPRLAFADYLQEQGKEFRHVLEQCQLKLNSDPRPRSFIIHPDAHPKSALSYLAGFIERVECTAEWWLTHAHEMTPFHPIRLVTLTTEPEWDWDRDDTGYEYAYFIGASSLLDAVPMGRGESVVTELLRENWPNIEFTIFNN